jgi:hypothetical protein
MMNILEIHGSVVVWAEAINIGIIYLSPSIGSAPIHAFLSFS